MAALSDDSTTYAQATPPRRSRNDASSSVQVAVRVRPMLASEAGSTQCIEVLRGADSDGPNIVRIGGESGPTFAFDEAFGGPSSQGHIYKQRVAPLVRSCMDGYNATCLAYGQTSSGKTHTIMGPSTSMAMYDDVTAGVIPRAFRDLFGQLERVRQRSDKENQPQDNDASYEYEVRVQFLEIYGEEIRDLLTPLSSERLTIRDIGLDDEPEVMGATKHKVESAEEALLCLTRGMMRRVTGATAMNASSSRSHAILSVLVEQTMTLEEPSCGERTAQHVQVKRSKFNFVDLAGSERQKRTQAEGQRLKEGIDINKGLLVLGNVISALGDPTKAGKFFVPYRDSKLTRLLKGSLGGNHKTLMIACVSPSSSNMEESLNCLRYANRAKNIQNNAVVNVDAGSRLVVELRQQVQALAADLLRAKEGDQSEGSFTIEILKSLATGSDSSGMVVNGTRSLGAVDVSSSGATRSDGVDLHRAQEVEIELGHTREHLRQAKVELLTTSEALHVTKAEKELYRLQLAATSDETPNMDMNAVFQDRVAAYEKEIASLKETVRKASVATITQEELSPEKGSLRSNTPLSDAPDVATLESLELVRVRSKVLQPISHSDQLEAEEQAESTEIAAITSKYLAEDLDDEQCRTRTLVGKQEPATDKGDSGHDGIDGSRRQTQIIEAHLFEISRSIEAKEDLINQLQLSQEKYAAMREFYEDKLHQMEELVRETESEREQLLLELQKMEESNSCTKDLQEKLRKKESHVAGLRKKQKELVTLTRVSSRNESEINRLHNEVVIMKQKKVDMQKLIASERKNHASEIQRLKKEAMNREREAIKWKRVSDKKAVEAEKAQQMAKARLEQVGQLRSKYKEAERKLRVRTVKRGVMEKAGLDPVIVGRRDSQPRTTASGSVKGRDQKRMSPNSEINFDAIRDFLDQKVAEVGRKEAIADKLANEWEDHLELVSQREELVGHSDNGGTGASADAIDGLDVQIQYKEERIRQLSRRLGKAETTKETKARSVEAAFLEDTGFTSILAEKSPLVAAKVAARVLFGMVVRERRRVASLARTASSLDEKALEAEKTVSSKDAAFRSYMEEVRRERESMAQSQQEQILSLMAMVQEHESTAIVHTEAEAEAVLANSSQTTSSVDKTSKDSVAADQSVNARVTVLANERIAAMQNQLQELQGERQAMMAYKEQEAEARSLLSSKEEECDALRKELNSLRSSLRQIRETLSHQNGDETHCEGGDQPTEAISERKDADQTVLGIVMNALHPPGSGHPSDRTRRTHSEGVGPSSGLRPKPFSSRLKRHVELMHSSDSEEDGEVPEWAGDIMADLAIIAGGQVPPSLQNVGAGLEMSAIPEKGRKPTKVSVFDRLTHPDNFTGVQKQRTARRRRINSAPGESTRGAQDERRATTRLVTGNLEKIAIPDEKLRGLASFEKQGSISTDEPGETAKGDTRSVFDRLLSPSNYTGTQKDKVQHSGPKKHRNDGHDALLDELLASDDDGFFPHDDVAHVDEQARASKMLDYTQQDVFERLQTTTTQSYAVKHINPPARSLIEHAAHTFTTEEIEEQNSAITSPPPESYVHTDHSEYFRQNVFERLQKTTTQAYAKKTNRGTSKDDHSGA